MKKVWRKTEQYLLPEEKPAPIDGEYNIYPSFKIENKRIFSGFKALSEILLKHKQIIIDGYTGVLFDHFRKETEKYLSQSSARISWINTHDFLKTPQQIEELVSAFTGGNDPVFGKRATLNLEDFFKIDLLRELKPDPEADINIIIGEGAYLSGWDGLLVYLDVPKNEIQFRSRAGSIGNIGSPQVSDAKEMYKRFYFVDWVVLNKHKQNLLPHIDLITDTQNAAIPVGMDGDIFRQSLTALSHTAFRVRPWFEPGVWGGSWIKDRIGGLNKGVPNYAWSFELIAPENGLLFESSGKLFESSFDFLMYQEGQNILGDCYTSFGTNFPIRFDFLDTFDGGNLSVQCHPRQDYMKHHFGEDFTQEECYYILDTKDSASVYLGFQEDISPDEFRNALSQSLEFAKPLDVERYVQKHDASKHDLFLIPPGTIHGSGKNNLVLEISSTPYIFTFKMYDWLRLDLDGKPRPLNIERGMENLYFERKGQYVKEKLISQPVLIDEGGDWLLYHLPTHETHLYDVNRYHFLNKVEIKTENKCHVLSLVEGKSITVETANGEAYRFNYAETFIIPAAAVSYRIINDSDKEAIVVIAFVK